MNCKGGFVQASDSPGAGSCTAGSCTAAEGGWSGHHLSDCLLSLLPTQYYYSTQCGGGHTMVTLEGK